MVQHTKINNGRRVHNASKATTVFSLSAALSACGENENLTDDMGSTGSTTTTTTSSTTTATNSPSVEVSLMIAAQSDAKIDEEGVTTLNVVFERDASLDSTALADVAVINLGQTETGSQVASLGRADFDGLSSAITTLNIHETQQNIELDYQTDVNAQLTINFVSEASNIQVGKDVSAGQSNVAIEILGSQTLAINNQTANKVEVAGSIDFNETDPNPNGTNAVVADTLSITTSQEGGDLTIGRTANVAAFENTGTLRDVSIHAVDGDMDLYETVNNRFMFEIDQLQTYSVLTDNADVHIGRLGACNEKTDMEIITLEVIDDGSIIQRTIEADDSHISLVSVTSADKNTLNANLVTTEATGLYNVVFEGLAAQSVRRLEVDAQDGGNILLANQSYRVDEIILTGTGDVTIEAGTNCSIVGQGFEQANVDTTDFEGDLTIITGGGNDTVNGSDGDDTIVLGTGGGTDVINDSPGDDTVTGSGTGTTLTINDSCEADSDDTYIITAPGFTPQGIQLTFNVGGGNDYLGLSNVTFVSAFGTDILIDFSDWCGGTVCINEFTPSGAAAGSQLDFSGLDGMVANNFVPPITAAVSSLTSSSVYSLGGAVAPNLADYHDLTVVANVLSASVSNNTSTGDAAVFIYENPAALPVPVPLDGAVNVAIPDTGNNYDFYTYYYQESDGQSGISASEISLIACINTPSSVFGGSVGFSAGDFV